MPLNITQEEFLEMLSEDYPTTFSSVDEESLYDIAKGKSRYSNFDVPDYERVFKPPTKIELPPQSIPYEEPDDGYLGLGGDWLPDVMKAGYNESISGIVQKILTGKDPFDVRKLFIDEETGEPRSHEDYSFLESVAISVASMTVLPDLIAMSAGGKALSMPIKAALTRSARQRVAKKLAPVVGEELAQKTAKTAVNRVIENGGKFTDMLESLGVRQNAFEEILNPRTAKWFEKGLRINESGMGFSVYEGMRNTAEQVREVKAGRQKSIDKGEVAVKMLEGYTLGAGVGMTHQVGTHLRRHMDGVSKAITHGGELAAEAGILMIPPMIRGEEITGEQFAHALGTIVGIRGVSASLSRLAKNKAQRDYEEQLKNDARLQEHASLKAIEKDLPEGSEAKASVSKKITDLETEITNSALSARLSATSDKILKDALDGTLKEKSGKGGYSELDFTTFYNEIIREVDRLETKISNKEKLTTDEKIDLDNYRRVKPAIEAKLGEEAAMAIRTYPASSSKKVAPVIEPELRGMSLDQLKERARAVFGEKEFERITEERTVEKTVETTGLMGEKITKKVKEDPWTIETLAQEIESIRKPTERGFDISETTDFKERLEVSERSIGDKEAMVELDIDTQARQRTYKGRFKGKFSESMDRLRSFIQNEFPGMESGGAGGGFMAIKTMRDRVKQFTEFAEFLADRGKSFRDVSRNDIRTFLEARRGKTENANAINALIERGYLSEAVSNLAKKTVIGYAKELVTRQHGLRSEHITSSKTSKEPTLQIQQSKVTAPKESPITSFLNKVLNKIKEYNESFGWDKIKSADGKFSFDYLFRDTNGIPLVKARFTKIFEMFFPDTKKVGDKNVKIYTPKMLRQSLATWIDNYASEINNDRLVKLFDRIGLGHSTGKIPEAYTKLSKGDRKLVKDAIDTYVDRIYNKKYKLKDWEKASGEGFISMKVLKERFAKIQEYHDKDIVPLLGKTKKGEIKKSKHLGVLKYQQEVSGETIKTMMRTALETGGRIVETLPDADNMVSLGFKPSFVFSKSKPLKQKGVKYKLAGEKVVPAGKGIMRKAADWVAEKYPELIVKFEKDLGIKNGREVLGKYLNNIIEIKEGRAPEDIIPHEVSHHAFKVLEAIGDAKSKKLIRDAKRLFKNEENAVDTIGKYITGRLKDTGLIAKARSWIKRFNANLKSFFNRKLTKADITTLLGEKILKGKLPETKIKMAEPEFKLGGRAVTKSEAKKIASVIQESLKRTENEKVSFKKEVEKARALEATSNLSTSEVKALRGMHNMVSPDGETGVQYAPHVLKVKQYVSSLKSLEDFKGDGQRPTMLSNLVPFESKDLSLSAELNLNWMPVYKVLERYGGRMGKKLSRKIMNHDVRNMLHSGQARYTMEIVKDLIGEKNAKYLVMRDDHLAQYLSKDPVAGDFFKKMNTRGTREYRANEVLQNYYDYVWAHGLRIAKNNMSASEFLDFKSKWNKKYVHDYFTRKLTDDAIVYLREQKAVGGRNEYQDIIDNVQEHRKKTATKSIRDKISEIEGSTSFKDISLLKKLRNEIVKREEIVENDRATAEKYIEAKIDGDMKTVFSKYFELERDVSMKLHLDDGKIQTYSTDFADIFSTYAKSQSRFLATAEEFPEFTFLSGKYTYSKRGDVRDWLGNLNVSKTGIHGYVKKALHQQLFGSFDVTTSKTNKLLKNVVGVFGSLGLSSPMSPIKNSLLGDMHTFSAFGTRSLFHSWAKMTDRDNWKRAMQQGALDAGTKYMQESGLYNWKASQALMKVSGMEISEKANRVRARLAGRFFFENAVKQLRGEKQSILKPSNRLIRDKLNNTFKFTNEEIAFLERYGTERSNIPKNAPGYTKLVEMQRFLNDKADVMSHISTQGMTTIPFMPLFASKTWVKPFLLFYRMAYAATSNAVDNVVKPLMAGNPFPTMRYIVAAGVTGEALWALYQGVFGIKRPSQDVGEHLVEDIVRAEILGLGTNVVSSYSSKPGIGGIIDSYTPFMVRSVGSLFGAAVHAVTGKPFTADKVDSAIQDIFVAYKHGKQALMNRANSYMTHRKNAKTHEIAFLRKEGKKEFIERQISDTRYLFYESMSKKFQLAETKKDYNDAAETAWASYAYVYHQFIKDGIGEADGWSKMRQEVEAHKHARGLIKGIMKRWKPFSWSDESPSGRQMWANFKRGKTDEQIREFEKIKSQYYFKYRKMEAAWLALENRYKIGYRKPKVDFTMRQL